MPHSVENNAQALSTGSSTLTCSGPSEEQAVFNSTFNTHLGPFELEAKPTPQQPTCPLCDFASQHTRAENSHLDHDIHGIQKDLQCTQDQIASLTCQVHLLSRCIGERHDVHQDTQATIPPTDTTMAAPPPPCPHFLSYTDYLTMLSTPSLYYLAPYAQDLDASANYAVAGTKNPNKKRCKVGRPRGKFLRRDQMDDLARQLYDFHKDEVGFLNQVLNHGRDPLVCLPVNEKDEEVDG